MQPSVVGARHPFDPLIGASSERLRTTDASVAISLADSTAAISTRRTRLLLKHFPKAGGQEAMAALKLVSSGLNFKVLNEWQLVTPQHQATALVSGFRSE